MIVNDTRPGPPGATMLICPLKDCPWRYERPAPSLEAAAAAGVRVTVPVASVDDLARELHAAEVRHTDHVVRAHLAEHPVEDFLITINDLRTQLATSQAMTAG